MRPDAAYCEHTASPKKATQTNRRSVLPSKLFVCVVVGPWVRWRVVSYRRSARAERELLITEWRRLCVISRLVTQVIKS